MVTATAILVAIAHDGSIGLALCLIEFPVPKKKQLISTSTQTYIISRQND